MRIVKIKIEFDYKVNLNNYFNIITNKIIIILSKIDTLIIDKQNCRTDFPKSKYFFANISLLKVRAYNLRD